MIGSGRKKGSKNVIGKDAKENIISVFVGLGGIQAMKEWAVANRTDFYTKIYAKLLPLKVDGTLTVTPQARVYPVLPDDNRLPTPSEAVDSVH